MEGSRRGTRGGVGWEPDPRDASEGQWIDRIATPADERSRGRDGVMKESAAHWFGREFNTRLGLGG